MSLAQSLFVGSADAYRGSGRGGPGQDPGLCNPVTEPTRCAAVSRCGAGGQRQARPGPGAGSLSAL